MGRAGRGGVWGGRGGTYIVQGGLADRVVLNAQHAHHLLHLTEHLSQRDVLRLQLVLHLRVVPLLGTQRSGGQRPLGPCPSPTTASLPTLSTASGKFRLKNRTTSFTCWLLLVLTVIM